MDTLTHTVLGACMGEAIAGRQLGKKAMLFGALANNLPDIDVISTLWCSPASELLAHRGITHSLLFNVIAMFGLASLGAKKWQEVSYRRWLLLMGSGLFTHIFIDACTSYGTGWFEPFNHYRVTFNNMFIFDPVFILPVLIGAIILLVKRRDASGRRFTAKLCMALFAAYLGFTFVNKIIVNRHVRESLEAQKIGYENYMVTPTPLNNFLWYVVTESPDGDPSIGYYSVFDHQQYVHFYQVPKNDSLLTPYREEDEVKKLLRFSKGFYCMRREEGGLVFNDMRYGQIGGWLDHDVPFVFRFAMEKNGTQGVKLQQGRFESVKGNMLHELFTRIKGD